MTIIEIRFSQTNGNRKRLSRFSITISSP